MPGTYIVNYSDPSNGQITIEPVTQNNSTSLTMVGYRYPVYGEAIWENFLHLLEHFANKLPPSSPITGQIWVDTSASPVVPKVYEKSGSSGVWREIGSLIHIGNTPPASYKGLWYKPDVNGLYFWNGTAWQNILCFVVANTTDYNDIVTEFNEILTTYGQAPITTLGASTNVSSAQWVSLVTKIKQIANYRRLPTRIVSKLVFEDMTKYCTDDTAKVSIFTIIRQYDRLLRAIDMISCCNADDVDPNCYDVSTPLSAIKTRSSTWSDIAHIGTCSFASVNAASIFFSTGGKIRWVGDHAAPPGSLPESREAAWAMFMDEVGTVELFATKTSRNGIQTGPGFNQLTSADQTLFTLTSKNPTSYYTSYYYQSGLTLTILGRKENNVLTLTIRFSDPDVDRSILGTLTSTISLTRVGTPCLDLAPAFPSVVSSGTI